MSFMSKCQHLNIHAVHQKGELTPAIMAHLETCSVVILAVRTVIYCCFTFY